MAKEKVTSGPKLAAISLPNFSAMCPDFLLKINHVIDLRILLVGLIAFIFAQSSLNSYTQSHRQDILTMLNNELSSELVPLEKIKVAKENSVETYIDETSEKAEQEFSQDDYIVNGLIQYTDIGYLPIIRRSDSLTSFRAYQQKFDFSNAPRRPFLSFVLQDFGVSKSLSKDALDILPKEVSLILSPYASLPTEWMNMAHAAGHEVWIDMPIQSAREVNRGELTLFHHDPLSEKQEKMRKVLTTTRGYAGVASFTDQQINVVPDQYAQIIDELYLRGLGYIELNKQAPPAFASRSLVGGVSAPYLRVDMILNTVLGPNNDFDKIEELAKHNGYALILVPNYPKVIKQLDVWLEKVAKHDYVLAPVSALYDLPLHRDVVLNNSGDHVQGTTQH